MGDEEVVFLEWVKLCLYSNDQQWKARVVQAIVAPKLAYPVILGGPFLKSNKIVIDHELGRITTKEGNYQLLPTANPKGTTLEVQKRVRGHTDTREVLRELQERT